VQADGERLVGKFRTDLPPMTSQKKQTLLTPLLIELCLQTAGVWEIGKAGVLVLPTAIERVIVHTEKADPSGVFYAEIEPKPGQGDEVCFDARIVDEHGDIYLELEGYRTARLPAPIKDEHVAPLRDLVENSAS